MRSGLAASLLALAWFFSGLLPVAGAVAGCDPIRINGREYVRVSEWARSKDLDCRWVKHDEVVSVGTQSWSVTLAKDSCEARVNGVQVWLSFPVYNRNGSFYLSVLDAEATLRPILATPRNRGAAVRTICIDAGHGGKDPGFRVGSRQEKKYTLLLAQELRQQLNHAGFKTSLTRSTDSSVDLPIRPELAKRRNADLFISLHFNAAEGSAGSVQGSEVYCLTPPGASSTNARGEGANSGWCAGNRHNDRNIVLAYQVQRHLIRDLGVEDRGVRRARFAVLRDAVMPAVLIEGGFMSHPIESKRIFDPDYRRRMARAVVEGVLAYKNLVERDS